MKLSVMKICIYTVFFVSSTALAECPLDHFIIGCNSDGIWGTDDDTKLFVDCRQKYRDSGDTEYSNWFYPLHKSIFSSYSYRLGEPGFDIFQNYNTNASYTYDPNRCLTGEPNTDYQIIVECVSMSTGLRAVHKEYPQFTIGEVGEFFNHSYIYDLRGDGHMHFSYQAVDEENLHWITYCLYDAFAYPNAPNHYQPSEPFTIVFNQEPLSGDLAVDDMVDIKDVMEFSYYWLGSEGNRNNDYYERADTNRDGSVDFIDFAFLASNWKKSLEDIEPQD